MNLLPNATASMTSLESSASAQAYYNLTPLISLIAVTGTILFCCVCLTSYNSYMKKHHDSYNHTISYGEHEQEISKFGRIFRTYLPSWIAKKIHGANGTNSYDEVFSGNLSEERERLLSLSRVHYLSYKQRIHLGKEEEERREISGNESCSSGSDVLKTVER